MSVIKDAAVAEVGLIWGVISVSFATASVAAVN